MKFPTHIILDVSKNNVMHSSQYWIFKYLFNFKNNSFIFDNLSFNKSFLLKKENLLLNKLIQNQKKYTIRYNVSNPALFLSQNKQKIFNNLFAPRLKVKSKLLYSKYWNKEIYDYLNNNKSLYDEKYFKRIIKNFSFKNSTTMFKINHLWNLFDINFLKKDKIYTKLKYSRVPQYDIVSGGSAALLAGFLGFLICEKFGFELIDSGDFYFLFMYMVFFCFIGKLFFKITDGETSSWTMFSFKWFLFFYKTIIILFLRTFSFLKK
jgi:hypothetical protein